ncbi:putative RNA-binding protein 46 isoform X1 [Stigmatopora nigra]
MVKGARKFNKSLSKQLALMDKTGYDILRQSGQRKYGVPPPGPAPRFQECQVFVGNIPRDMYEIELVPLFKTAGTIFELRLTVEFSGEKRRYAYVTYTKKEEATLAVDMFDQYEVRRGRFLAVCLTVNNCHLLAGNIPTEKTREEGNKVPPFSKPGAPALKVYWRRLP